MHDRFFLEKEKHEDGLRNAAAAVEQDKLSEKWVIDFSLLTSLQQHDYVKQMQRWSNSVTEPSEGNRNPWFTYFDNDHSQTGTCI